MANSSSSIYRAAEHRAISSWLGVEPLEPVDPSLTLSRAIRSLGIRKRPFNGRRKIDAAIAKIVLANSEARLPVWNGQGLPPGFRAKLKMPPRGLLSRQNVKVAIAPRLICEINWVFSGPGIPWPSRYLLSFLPLYNRFVVTESQDTDEGHGYYDFAIGSFASDRNIEAECEQIIQAHWGHEPLEWDGFLEPGIIKAARRPLFSGR